MTHTRQYADDEGTFSEWQPVRAVLARCPKIVPVSGLPCGHPVEVRTWESHDGAFEDYQYRCLGGGHVWWIDGIDA
jgi:hypothetical protein